MNNAIATLLREHEKHDQAVQVQRDQLRKLYLSLCRIGDDGAEIVAAFIMGNETVKKVWVTRLVQHRTAWS